MVVELGVKVIRAITTVNVNQRIERTCKFFAYGYAILLNF